MYHSKVIVAVVLSLGLVIDPAWATSVNSARAPIPLDRMPTEAFAMKSVWGELPYSGRDVRFARSLASRIKRANASSFMRIGAWMSLGAETASGQSLKSSPQIVWADPWSLAGVGLVLFTIMVLSFPEIFINLSLNALRRNPKLRSTETSRPPKPKDNLAADFRRLTWQASHILVLIHSRAVLVLLGVTSAILSLHFNLPFQIEVFTLLIANSLVLAEVTFSFERTVHRGPLSRAAAVMGYEFTKFASARDWSEMITFTLLSGLMSSYWIVLLILHESSDLSFMIFKGIISTVAFITASRWLMRIYYLPVLGQRLRRLIAVLFIIGSVSLIWLWPEADSWTQKLFSILHEWPGTTVAFLPISFLSNRQWIPNRRLFSNRALGGIVSGVLASALLTSLFLIKGWAFIVVAISSFILVPPLAGISIYIFGKAAIQSIVPIKSTHWRWIAAIPHRLTKLVSGLLLIITGFIFGGMDFLHFYGLLITHYLHFIFAMGLIGLVYLLSTVLMPLTLLMAIKRAPEPIQRWISSRGESKWVLFSLTMWSIPGALVWFNITKETVFLVLGFMLHRGIEGWMVLLSAAGLMAAPGLIYKSVTTSAFRSRMTFRFA